MNKNSVYIAKSLDGYIADKNGGIDWLNAIPNPENEDMGYADFMNRIDAIVMGRGTFDVVMSFDMEWPYQKPVFVLSNSLKKVPEKLIGKLEILSGSLTEVIGTIHNKGHKKLYIDGGKTVQNFLKENLIDELILTTIPILLGGGIPLFGELPQPIELLHVESKVFLNAIVQDSYRIKLTC
ncbi:MAG: dihydrofolate reductase family protein [Prolixibacteraceae bacterium]